MSDNVNNPSYYNDGKIEVIDFIEDKNLNFHLGNAVKYISRAGKKDPDKTVEDLKKARWYLDREINNLESKTHMNDGFFMQLQGVLNLDAEVVAPEDKALSRIDIREAEYLKRKLKGHYRGKDLFPYLSELIDAVGTVGVHRYTFHRETYQERPHSVDIIWCNGTETRVILDPEYHGG